MPRADEHECLHMLCAFLLQELSVLHESGSLDGFGLYMFGIVLKEMKVVRSVYNIVVIETNMLCFNCRD
jgi:hypothetical protein